MNPLCKNPKTGTIGELLVQIRLLQFDVQAAPPLKDTGNDLIAVRGGTFRAIQVKTTAGDHFDLRHLPRRYHIVACVHLVGQDRTLDLDKSGIYVLGRHEVRKTRWGLEELTAHELSQQLIDRLFAE